jgi:MarR family transcriptional regulator for hemolysin
MEAEQLRDGFARMVALAARQWRRAVDLRLQPFGLTEATWLPLLHLARAPAPLRQKELATSLSLDSSSVVRLLDGLQALGLIERREEAADRRAKTILLTPLGQATVEQVEAVSRQVRQETLGGLAEADLRIASQVLQQVCQKLVQAMEQAA